MDVDPKLLRRFDQNVLKSSGQLEHRVIEPVPYCWMCGATAGKRAKEHVFPKWLIEHFGAAGERVQPYRMSMALGGATVSQRNDIPIGSVLAGEVCAACNGGWMNDLEGAVRPIFAASVRRGRIQPTEAMTLARWFTKTAIGLNVSMPFRLLFDADTRHGVAFGMPDSVSVGLFRVRQVNGSFDWAQSTLTHALGPASLKSSEDFRRLMATAYVGRVRIQRLVGTVVVLPEPLRHEYLDTGMARIWPLPDQLPTWGALPMFDHYLKPMVGVHLPQEWAEVGS